MNTRIPARPAVRQLALRQELKTGRDVASHAWGICDSKEPGKYAKLVRLGQMVVSQGSKLDIVPHEAARLSGAFARGKVSNAQLETLLCARVFIKDLSPKAACVFVTSLVQMASTNTSVFRTIERHTLSTTAHELCAFDKVHIANCLAKLRYNSGLQHVFRYLTVHPSWTQEFDGKAIASFMSVCCEIRHMPEGLVRDCFDRILQLQGPGAVSDPPGARRLHRWELQPCSDGTTKRVRRSILLGRRNASSSKPMTQRELAYVVRALAVLPEAVEVRSFGIPLLVNAALQREVGNTFQLSGDDLAFFAYAFGKASLPLSSAGPLWDRMTAGDGGVSLVSGWRLPSQVKVLNATAGVLAGSRFEGVNHLPSQYQSLVDALSGEVCSVETLDRHTATTIASVFWSFSSLRVDDQFLLQGAASVLRENAELFKGMHPHNVDRIALSMSKLRMLADSDIIENCMSRVKEFVGNSSNIASICVANVAQALGVFCAQFHRQQNAAFGKVIIALVVEKDFDGFSEKNLLIRIAWALARLQVVPGSRFAIRINSMLESFRDINDYEAAQIKEWHDFVAVQGILSPAVSPPHAPQDELRERNLPHKMPHPTESVLLDFQPQGQRPAG
ncbi:hypothetical protein DIPPA_17109 [Diplonema papillatum]|nr:hypothetical protein DIPPA_17109 [Diplonema papillatum]